ncbi:hypothetical protein DH2020_043620 [Rehmannia glutinosa]|uniref:Reverse transcriptase zinc-binding domain-containing protein n=1 Tax=Rehmannia glutinosa TaxID=99300 RepID=A0ABR0UJ58_REHGL
MPIGSMPFKYLGIPLAAEKLKAVHYASLVEKIAGYINVWANCTLTYARQMELIRSVVQGVECFWLSILPIPSTVIDRITNICRLFLWGERKALVAWKDICLPKTEGGLGFRDVRTWNLALLAKVLWNIHDKRDSLWIRWVDQVYLNGASVWNWTPAKGDSLLLKRIFQIRDIIVSKEGTTQLAIAILNRWFAGENYGCLKAYDYFRPRGTPKVWATDVWRHYIPLKHSFIIWLGIKGMLQTNDRLHYMDIDRNCAFCGTALETLDHIFFQCNMTKQVWIQIKKWLRITRAMNTIKSALKYMKKEARGTSWQSCAKKSAVACTVYHIWTARNRRLFEGTVVTSDGITREIKT